VHVVTGAFGNVGGAIARRLLDEGHRVRTLTNRPADPSLPVEVAPLALDDPGALGRAFAGATAFYNTFWMRTGSGGGRSYDLAVARSRRLLDAAATAGVDRIAHVSVVKPSVDSPYPYFRAKAEVEAHLAGLAVPVAVVRPALIFGGEAAMLHDLARVLRRSPVFGLPGGGRFHVRPVHVDDVARLCLEAEPGRVLDAVGPERPTFRELVTGVRTAVGARCLLLPMPTGLVLAAARLIGRLTGEELLTADELRSTVDGLADADGPATGERRLSTWLAEHGEDLGRR
jgi:uncharacterized protein YbjT (DUF2867 family)